MQHIGIDGLQDHRDAADRARMIVRRPRPFLPFMAHSRAGTECPMTMTIRPRKAIVLALIVGLWPTVAAASCFSSEDTREHVQRHGLIPLNDIVRSARGSGHADLISARLCETSGNLVYMIAMLGRDGRVLRLTVDARTGDVINNR
jgi:hypothetical protein